VQTVEEDTVRYKLLRKKRCRLLRKRRCRLVRERIRRRRGRDERPGKRVQSLPPQDKLGKGVEGPRQVQRVEGEDVCGIIDRGRGGGTRWIWILDCWIQGPEELEGEL
jgi:hypothetical protein